MKNRTELEKRGGGNLKSLNLGAFQLSPFKRNVILNDSKRNALIKLSAFTLAEVLIILGIIGVVAAMTIPNLMQKCFEIQTVTRFKEVTSILSQAMRLAVEDNGEVSSWGNVTNTEAGALAIAKNLKPYLKLAHDCGALDPKGICIYPNTYYLKNGNKHVGYAASKNYYKIILMNGSSVWWRGKLDSDTAKNGEVPIMAFFFDINGKKLPNIIGQDVFQFFYYENYGLIPNGWNKQDECLKPSSSGFSCTYYLFKNGKLDYMKK